MLKELSKFRNKKNYINFSIVVPAYNAESTLEETLDSIASQTYPVWEGIIVNDGSTDRTGEIAASWVQKDDRICVINQMNGGESAARNTGIQAARNDWLVFLDADDWLAPEYLERMAQKIATDPNLDGVVCGCVRVTPSGQLSSPAIYDPSLLDKLFLEFVKDCPFAIHNCTVRRSLVNEIGGFDTGLVTCADWDFWQRFARTGARLDTVPEVLAYYRMRPGSASTDAERVLVDGLTVIRRGHGRDPRVSNPHPDYAEGMSADGLAEAMFRHALWPASHLLVRGEDPQPLLQLMGAELAPTLDPLHVALWMFEYIPLAAAVTTRLWPEMWPTLSERLGTYLVALEAQSGAVGLAIDTSRHLERLIIDVADLKQPLNVGSTHGVRIDVDRPIADVEVPEDLEQLNCVVDSARQYIGSVQLPNRGGVVTGKAIAEAIAANLALPIMLRYFRIDLPRDSCLRMRLHGLMHEKRFLLIVFQFAGLVMPLIRWQLRDGLLRKPRLLARFLWLILEMRPLYITFQLIRARPQLRGRLMKEFLWDMGRRLVEEDGLVTAKSTEESVQRR